MHPVLFEVAGLPVYSYGVMLGTSLVVAWYVVMYLGTRKEGLTREVMGTTFIITALVALLMARVLYVATNPDEFHQLSDFFAFRSGGLVAYGGFLGGLLGSWLYLRRRDDATLLGWADVTAPTLGLGLGFTRIGCYLFGCDFGAPLTESAPQFLRDWGTFPHWDNGDGSPAFVHHVTTYDLSPLARYSLPVHPTQLYESAFGFVLAAIAFAVWQRRRFRGQVILIVAGLYGVWRFFIEYVRDDPERGEYFGFSTSQWISLALVPIVGFLYHQLSKKPSPLVAPTPEPVAATAGAAASPARSGTGKRTKKKKKK
ncbi:MAG: prolipoprotein diacylglyceryl transferase [Sandaracinaceae bacterium]